MCLVIRVNIMYNYQLKIDITAKEYEALSGYLFKYHGMKPTIHKRGNNYHVLQFNRPVNYEDGKLQQVYFSYETPIGFSVNGGNGKEYGHVVKCKNIWSSTTGKHLNMTGNDTSTVLENSEFVKLLDEYLNN